MQQQGKEEGQMEGEQEAPRDYVNRKVSELSDLQLRYTYSNASSTSEFSMYEPAGEQFEAKFVRDEQLYAQLLEKVNYVRSVVNCDSDDLCLYVLHTYQWNEEKLANFFFNEDWSSLAQAQLTYAQLTHSQPQSIGECSVCLTHAPLYSTGFCPHAYCAQCWAGYLKEELQAGRIFPSCMEVPCCPKAPVLRGFVEMVAPELSQLNRKKTCVSYALQNKDICYCPNERCPYFCIKPNMMELSTVACPCGELYCYRCRREPHYPVACEEVKRWYLLLNSEQANSSWIRNNTRECPKCHQPIEKKVGCSHMKCICQCEFCYQCNRPWDSLHANRTDCPSRASLPQRQQQMDRVAELDGSLIEMMREAEKNRALLAQCQGLLLDETLQARVVQLKTEVLSAWLTFKWTKIVLCLDGRPDIDPQLQKECINSIHLVMQPVEIIARNAKGLASKELHNYGELVLQRNQILKKHVRTWLDAWELASA